MDATMIIRFMMMPIISAALKGINWEEGNRLLYLRIVFMGVQLATLLVYGLIYVVIWKTRDQRSVTVPIPVFKQNAGGPKEEKVTVQAYDTQQLMSMIMNNVLSLALTLFLHLKFGFIPPLCMGIAMTPIQLWGQKLFQLHILRIPEQPGKTTRPFPKSPGLMDLMKQFQEQPAGPAPRRHARSD